MKTYDPMCAPDPQTWLALNQDTRLALVRAFHRTAGFPLQEDSLHAACHVMVETQLATNQPAFVRSSLERLMQEGLNRGDAINAICMVLSWNVTDAADGGYTVLEQEYEKDLNEMTAEEYRVQCEGMGPPEYDELPDEEEDALLDKLSRMDPDEDLDELEEDELEDLDDLELNDLDMEDDGFLDGIPDEENEPGGASDKT